MTINNGLLKDYPIYTPNASYQPMVKSLQPKVIIAEEYNAHFYEGEELTRTFNVYNDSYEIAHVQVKYQLKNGANDLLVEGSDFFMHLPGEPRNMSIAFKLPAVKYLEKGCTFERFTLEVDLFHEAVLVDRLVKEYKIYPQQSQCSAAYAQKILYVGAKEDYTRLQEFIGGTLHEGEITSESLVGMDIVLLGRNYPYDMKEAQVLLQPYVAEGGFLIIMEQDKQSPGELVLSGRREHNPLIVDGDHPIFKGLSDEDFADWSLQNTHVPDCYRPIINAFEKPTSGDFHVLLECGDGDFGWGGLLWAAMLEYRIGRGRVLLQQLDLTAKVSEIPQVKLLLDNIFSYAAELSHERKVFKTGIYAGNDPSMYEFFDKVGVHYEAILDSISFSSCDMVIVNADSIDNTMELYLRDYVYQGGRLLILPMHSFHVKQVGMLLDKEITLIEKDIYQFKAIKHPLTTGISAYDTYHFENVTYTPANKTNSIVAEQAISMKGLEPLFKNIKAPWEDLYVKHFSGEPIKQATIQMAEDREYVELYYGGELKMGEGKIVFSQFKMDLNNVKLIRCYSRLLANMGAEIETNLLTYVKEEKDFGIGTFMALKYETHQDYLAEEAYFSDEQYVLNNLGEGVYGWMKRVEKKDGFITIEESAGKIYFLTLFVYSELNRNPLKRSDGELPDSSIVPDLLLSINCEAKIYINGKNVFDRKTTTQQEDYKIEDIVLDQGLNRLALVIFGGKEPIKFNACFINKYGGFINDLKYALTMD
jgi:beta-galactosidase